jgi:hypothetical protein
MVPFTALFRFRCHPALMSEYIDLAGERLDVEVLVDGTWYPGQLHAWSRPGATHSHSTGWWGHVTYRTGPGERLSRTVPSERIRQAHPPV